LNAKDSDSEGGTPQQLDELCTDNTGPGHSVVAINKGEVIQVSVRQERPVGQDNEPSHLAAEQIIIWVSPSTQFQAILSAMMSTIQADKRKTTGAIIQEDDRIDKKIMDEVKQLERNVRDENQR
jgi:hypothetical protein